MDTKRIDSFEKVLRFKRLSPECQLVHVFMIWNAQLFDRAVRSMDLANYKAAEVEQLIRPDISKAFLHYPLDPYEVTAILLPEDRLDSRYYIAKRLSEELKSQTPEWIAGQKPQTFAFLTFDGDSQKQFSIKYHDLFVNKRESP